MPISRVGEQHDGGVQERHRAPITCLGDPCGITADSQLDRSNIGNAKVGGMEDDLKLDSTRYSVVLLIFFIGYLLFEVPSNMILARSRPSLFLPALMFTWGGLSIAPVGIHNFGGMVAFRFILGLIEAGFFPGVMLLLSCWYKPAELSKRIAVRPDVDRRILTLRSYSTPQPCLLVLSAACSPEGSSRASTARPASVAGVGCS